VGPGGSTEDGFGRSIIRCGKPLQTLAPIREAAPDGALLITVSPEQVTVSLDFVEPRRSLVSRVISIIGWLLLVVLASVRKKGEQWIEVCIVDRLGKILVLC